MLKDTFFLIVKDDSIPGSIKALLSINKNHEILKGHFPGQPVVPGVCMMQMIKELVEHHSQRKLRISEAENMKFLAVIDPNQNNEVEATISYAEENGSISINASLFNGPLTFFKLKAILKAAK